MAARERDLFRAIVLSGVALVSTPGCGQSSAPTDTGAAPNDAGNDAATLLADVGLPLTDAGTPSDANVDASDAFVVIL